MRSIHEGYKELITLTTASLGLFRVLQEFIAQRIHGPTITTAQEPPRACGPGPADAPARGKGLMAGQEEGCKDLYLPVAGKVPPRAEGPWGRF